MKFAFAPWDFEGNARGGGAMAKFLQQQAEEPLTAGLLETISSPHPVIDFLVVDVTPSTAVVGQLEHALATMLLASEPPWPEVPGRPIARFLFVGATSALDAWENEKDAISIKKSVEFYIRTLQSSGLAHYGTGGPDVANLSAPLAASALLGLMRHYENKKLRPLAKEVATLRQHIDKTFRHARDQHRHLIELQPQLPREARNMDLLLSLNAVMQFGKRQPERAYQHGAFVQFTPDRSARTGQTGEEILSTTEPERPSGYGLWAELDERIAEWGAEKTPPDAAMTVPIADLSLGLQRYNLLRDLARCVGTGAVPALIGASKAIGNWGILIVDDGLYDAAGRAPVGGLLKKLIGKLGLIGWQGACFATRSSTFKASDSQDLLDDDERLQAGIDVRPIDPATAAPSERPRPEDFRLILVEVDPGVDYLGPKLVNRIASYLDKANDPKRRSVWRDPGAPPRTPSPPIIVLTRTENFGQIQQSLNFGAVAYVLKDRLYQLPYQMHLALDAADWERDRTPHFSSFRALHKLRPEVKAKLQTRKDSSILRGGRTYRNEQGLHLVPDCREELWVHELPKADLHCHMGTCIHPATIRQLALNTFGHMMESIDHREAARRGAIDRTVLSVVLAEHFHASAKGSIAPLICLAVAAAAVTGASKLELPDFGIGNRIIEWLTRTNEDLKSFQMTAILVSAIGWQADEDGIPPPDTFGYLASLAALEQAQGSNHSSRQGYNSKEALDIAAREAMTDIFKIAKSRQQPDGFTSTTAATRWTSLRKHVTERVDNSSALIERKRDEWWRLLTGPTRDWPVAESRESLDAAIQKAVTAFGVDNIARLSVQRDLVDVKRAFQLPGPRTLSPVPLPIQRYVELPLRESSRSDETSLRRYLWGADFLGADHLQYPENLLMAAFAIVADNTRDNVIYSEIRCETPGYCEAGMHPAEATVVLRRSFDLAALFLANSRQDIPLVRTNILLAAKRHKDRGPAMSVAELLAACLKERDDDRYWHIYPDRWWWQPSRVIGFDLSGDETAKEPEWLPDVRARLAKMSSPITIHAGEAASVTKIEEAIHHHLARRIGHGLKLRADQYLQNYCVREGICMEMCPNSNVFTNTYELPENTSSDDAESQSGRAYPLRDYMEAGLEVCLATDNRYIHRTGTQTLTSEYMTAARLSSGLTRWEILQLVKAGFKNAFLPKQEVEALISAMEERVYRILSRGWF